MSLHVPYVPSRLLFSLHRQVDGKVRFENSTTVGLVPAAGRSQDVFRLMRIRATAMALESRAGESHWSEGLTTLDQYVRDRRLAVRRHERSRSCILVSWKRISHALRERARKHPTLVFDTVRGWLAERPGSSAGRTIARHAFRHAIKAEPSLAFLYQWPELPAHRRDRAAGLTPPTRPMEVPIPVRILLVIDSLDVGGAERHVTDLALALQGDGHEVTVACASGGLLLTDLQTAGIAVHVLMKRGVKRRVNCTLAWRLRAVVRTQRFDLVHAHLYASAAAASLATIGTGSALVITVHSEGSWQGVVARRVSRLVYRRADALIAVSRPIARLLTDRYRVPSDRVNVIANALFSAAPISRIADSSPARDGKLVGVISRLQWEKGVDLFLDAAARLLPRHPDIRCIVIGDGPLADRLERQAHQLDVLSHVRFLGSRRDARHLIPSFDVLVMPSRSEGSPLVVLEALAAGVAVIATRVGGVPEQLRHGVDGLLVAPNDAQALGDAIDVLLTQPALRQRLASEGRRHAACRFSYAAVLENVERVYCAALARRRIRRSIQPEPSWE